MRKRENVALNFLTIFKLVLEGAVAVENTLGSTHPHETKKQIVVDSVDAVAKTLESDTNPQVAGVAGLVDLGVETFAALYDSITGALRKTGTITSPGPKPTVLPATPVDNPQVPVTTASAPIALRG